MGNTRLPYSTLFSISPAELKEQMTRQPEIGNYTPKLFKLIARVFVVKIRKTRQLGS